MTGVFIASGWDYIFHLEQSGWPKDCMFLRLLEAKEFSFSLDKEDNMLYDGMFDEIVPPLAMCLFELWDTNYLSPVFTTLTSAAGYHSTSDRIHTRNSLQKSGSISLTGSRLHVARMV